MKPSDKIKELILKKEFKKWADENQTFINDLHDLISQMLMFEIKYGTKILYEIQKPNTK
jgi:hypothetical protein